MKLTTGAGADTYEWRGDWASFPDAAEAARGWAHHGVAVASGDRVVLAHPADARILVYGPDGRLERSFRLEINEAHGLTVSKEGGREVLWVADIGCKADPARNYEDGTRYPGGKVLKASLEGKVLQAWPSPAHPAYAKAAYMPTSVSVNPAGGDVWVADGYGASLVHRFDRSGRLLATLTGEEGKAGRFSCPHAVFVRERGGKPEILVADRSNRRIQAYDAEGRWLRAFGEGFLLSPSSFCAVGDRLIVGELHARLAVLDMNDRLVRFLGENAPICATEGWPNRRTPAGLARIGAIEPGRFNAPHGLAADSRGNLYVSEWMIGGRLTRLSPCAG